MSLNWHVQHPPAGKPAYDSVAEIFLISRMGSVLGFGSTAKFVGIVENETRNMVKAFTFALFMSGNEAGDRQAVEKPLPVSLSKSLLKCVLGRSS